LFGFTHVIFLWTFNVLAKVYYTWDL